RPVWVGSRCARLAIWAMEEVSSLSQEPEYAEWARPHIRRKAELIEAMLAADRPMYQPVAGLIVERARIVPQLSLVCSASQYGLIAGRIEYHWPMLYVNAASYRGLMSAAAFAERLGDTSEALEDYGGCVEAGVGSRVPDPDLTTRPEEMSRLSLPALKIMWSTYASSLWPTWVATSSTDLLLRGLQARWELLREPGGFRDGAVWSYLDLAEAHQWLLLGYPDRVWATLNWFWDHQASPGLYTWWAGNDEGNTLHRWN
ncbi:MAG: hypothetical protein C4294_16080, partial [Nitrospiraceae bacterium]